MLISVFFNSLNMFRDHASFFFIYNEDNIYFKNASIGSKQKVKFHCAADGWHETTKRCQSKIVAKQAAADVAKCVILKIARCALWSLRMNYQQPWCSATWTWQWTVVPRNGGFSHWHCFTGQHRRSQVLGSTVLQRTSTQNWGPFSFAQVTFFSVS